MHGYSVEPDFSQRRGERYAYLVLCLVIVIFLFARPPAPTECFPPPPGSFRFLSLGGKGLMRLPMRPNPLPSSVRAPDTQAADAIFAARARHAVTLLLEPHSQE